VDDLGVGVGDEQSVVGINADGVRGPAWSGWALPEHDLPKAFEGGHGGLEVGAGDDLAE
jgi:hypothetical protein